jgi:hypothetical protein
MFDELLKKLEHRRRKLDMDVGIHIQEIFFVLNNTQAESIATTHNVYSRQSSPSASEPTSSHCPVGYTPFKARCPQLICSQGHKC